ERAVRVAFRSDAALVVHIAEQDAPRRLQLLQGRLVADIAAFAVRNRDAQRLSRSVGAGKGRLGILHAQPDIFAEEFALLVANQRAGQKVRLAQDLEPVADAEDQA